MRAAVRAEVPKVISRRPARASGERSHLTRWADLPGVELLTADYKNHAYVPHWHDALTVALVAQGCMRIKLAGSSHLVSAGSVLLLDPGRIHDGEAHDAALGWEYRVFYLDMQVIDRTSVDLGVDLGLGDRVGDTFRRTVIENRGAWSRMLQIHSALSSSQTLLERSSTLFDGVADLLRRTTTQSIHPRRTESGSPGLERARDYLHANWDVPVSLDSVALVAGLSRFHFLRTFRKRYGLPPHAYQLQLRIHRAKEMMFQGFPARDVALETGFHDQAHLTHTMHRFVGVAPGQIQERIPPLARSFRGLD
jgi:AraC-like DNA-binding protein